MLGVIYLEPVEQTNYLSKRLALYIPCLPDVLTLLQCAITCFDAPNTSYSASVARLYPF